jgi:hypothetical protein
MKLVEFIAPLRKRSQRDKILCVMYYYDYFEKLSPLSVDQIRKGLKNARVNNATGINISAILNRSGAFVDIDRLDGHKRLWSITDTGKKHVASIMDIGTSIESKNDVSSLKRIIDNIHDEYIKDYLEEALNCLKVNALRACVVFTWSATIRKVQEKILTANNKNLNLIITKHDPKSKNVSRIDDFSYVKDRTTLLGALDLGIIDKNEKDTLLEALNLRNRCGHPGKYKPGLKKVSAFIEDVISIVFD